MKKIKYARFVSGLMLFVIIISIFASTAVAWGNGIKFTLKDVHFNIIAHVVTCTGQERFLSTREYVLDGADGIVFVGDS
ncbi:hypothetical protein LCGC14_2785190, partial [marine sediment metagenome]